MKAEAGVEAGTTKRRVFRRVMAILVIAYVGWCAFLYVMQGRLMFPRGLTAPATPEQVIPPHIERLWVETGAGAKTEAWFVRANVPQRAPLAIFMHGNAELIDHCLGDAARWNARGYHVLLVEYRGYGRSGGSPSESGIVSDAVAFFDMVKPRPEVDAERIVVHGRSLGAGVAAQLAARRAVAGLVLESPFRSAASFAARFGAPTFLVTSPFRTDRVIAGIAAPVLILHSRDDEIIPVAHGHALRRARPDSTFVELTGGHNSGLSSTPEYWNAVEKWLPSLGP